MKKRTLQILCLSLALILLLSACSNSDPAGTASKTPDSSSSTPGVSDPDSPSNETAVSDETLHVVLDAEPTALYPQFGNMAQGMITVGECMYEYLVYWDSDSGSVVPGLATSWEAVDASHWRFHLREGVTAEDGSPFTAEDVLYSFQVGCDGTDVAAWSRMFDMDGFEVEDDHTIIIATKSPAPKLPEVLTKSAYGMLSQSAVENSGGLEAQQLAPHGATGKYVFDEWASGQYIRLVRNENYWNQDDLGYFAEIEFTFVGDAATRVMSLQSGESAYTYNLTMAQIQSLEGNSIVRPCVYESPNAYCVIFNCGKAPFDDARVREAIYCLVNADECTQLTTGGVASVSNSMLGTTSPYYSSPADVDRTVDIDRAKALLTEAGYADGLSISAKFSGDSTLYEVIQSQLRKGGVELELIPTEYAGLKSSMREGTYDLYIDVVKTTDIIQTFQLLDARVGYANNAGGCQCTDEELFAILDEVYAELDDAAALEKYAELQDYVRENHVIIGLYDSLVYTAMSNDYSDPVFDMTGSVNLSSVRRVG